MKLLHTGDLHLDSAFSGKGTLLADRRREAQRRLLERIVRLAEEEACDMILIAGDLFDGKYVTPETAELACRLFGETKRPIVIAPGNHDPYVKGSFYQTAELPENVYVFSASELQCFFFEEWNLSVYGYAFLSAAITESPLNQGAIEPKGEGLRVFCAHADLTSPVSRYAPVTEGDLLQNGFDYAALGHVHNSSEIEEKVDPSIRYCGFAEGRSFDELGEGGVLIVTLEQGEPARVERKCLSETRYLAEEVDLSGCGEAEEIRQRIAQAVSRFDGEKETHMRLSLVGTADAALLGDMDRLAEEVKGSLASLELKDLTVPVADGNALSKDVTLRGALYKSLYAGLIAEDPAVRRRSALALQIGLAAIDNRKIPERSADQ
ncbi:MAG: DNA repair exonuclease [Clostridia bacterium]|nr:DNA repair exonuclease [Clostridia bacterium]